MKIKNRVMSLAMAAVFSSPAAFALPDARTGNPLAELGIETPEGLGDIVRDHEFPNTLHVGPAGTKTITGVYTELSGSGPQCSAFVNIRKQAYLFPATRAQIDSAYLNKEFVSNFYQLTYALPRNNMDIALKIEKAYDSIRNAGQVNAAITEEYLALSGQWAENTVQLSAIEKRERDLNETLNKKIGSCLQDPETVTECFNNAFIDFNAASAVVTEERSALQETRDSLSAPYFKAKGAYDAVNDEIARFESDTAFYKSIYQFQSLVIESAWGIENELLTEEEGKIVGRATAGYNLFGNEAAILSSALNGKGGYQVKQLDVFNIRLNTGVTLENTSVEMGNGANLYHKNTWSFPADTLLQTGFTSEWEMPFERKRLGDVIRFETMDKDSFGSGGVNFYVTKGARCGEYTQSVMETYSARSDNGTEVSWSVSQQSYEPQGNRTVFAESIGLTYDYYAYPGPLEGECSIDVDRMSSYWRNAGRSSSWSWFKKTTETWDHTKQWVKDKMGMECELSVKPLSNDAAEAQRLAEEFEAHMYNDMWQMFLTIYAKEYMVEVLDPELTDPGKSTVGKTLGTGLMKICGANVYCQFSAIVLKTLDEIGGSKATGTTSDSKSVYGKVWKRYNKNAFSVKQGSSVINLKVCVNASGCK